MGRLIAHIILTGESALDEVFLNVVSNAMIDVLIEAVALPYTETSDEDGESTFCNSERRGGNGEEEVGRS